ncbi:hypothetical protein I4F81_010435 [Pyropia yezoensis]|uniref:Uncharacterized protein n=1 Tax=Pyropia yezoensis TaxID=2788 RepID=A0ACC3CCX2_PYRYE|nr:hypothetical protein I4F81_010435 [Neopyropia yezoensis]
MAPALPRPHPRSFLSNAQQPPQGRLCSTNQRCCHRRVGGHVHPRPLPSRLDLDPPKGVDCGGPRAEPHQCSDESHLLTPPCRARPGAGCHGRLPNRRLVLGIGRRNRRLVWRPVGATTAATAAQRARATQGAKAQRRRPVRHGSGIGSRGGAQRAWRFGREVRPQCGQGEGAGCNQHGGGQEHQRRGGGGKSATTAAVGVFQQPQAVAHLLRKHVWREKRENVQQRAGYDNARRTTVYTTTTAALPCGCGGGGRHSGSDGRLGHRQRQVQHPVRVERVRANQAGDDGWQRLARPWRAVYGGSIGHNAP